MSDEQSTDNRDEQRPTKAQAAQKPLGYPLVHVCYYDQVEPAADWHYVAEVAAKADPAEVVVCHAVGWLIAKSQASVVVAPYITAMGPQCRGHLGIPAGTVISIEQLCVGVPDAGGLAQKGRHE